MLVREKDGFYAGQIRDFPSHVALELIANGRAVNPFNEIEDTPEERAAFASGGPITAPAVRVIDVLMQPRVHDQEMQAARMKQAQSRRKGR